MSDTPSKSPSNETQTSQDSTPRPKNPKAKRKYVPAVTPRLRIALTMVFALFALLAANSLYLISITALEAVTGFTYQDFFYLCMFMLHLALGVLLLGPFIIFAFFHLLATRKRKNQRAVKMGYALLAMCITLLVSGILLTRVGDFGLRHDVTRRLVYLAHIITPLGAVWLYWLHRLAGPPIKWRVGMTYAAVVAAILIPMVFLQFQDPRQWSVAGSPEGAKYFEPSSVRTPTGNFIPVEALDNDEYCMKCHQDVYESWTHSAHRFSSFNNPTYLTSIVQLREELMERDGDVRASRWCAGCHDPVPFFGGKFDDPDYDVYKDPTAHAGITCTTCHAITNINSPIGNADYTIEEPIHYPFAYSDNPILQWINNQLVKAKPSFHKKVMLKPLHKTSEFCGTCHKVHLPGELTQYKDFLRGQNHYDPWLLSGVSGHGIRSFYYPPEAETNCNRCHMPLMASNDFGSKDFDDSGVLKAHDHLFPSANTGVLWLKGDDDFVKNHREFLDGVMRVDIFGLKEGDGVDAPIVGPLRAGENDETALPALKPGQKYLLETVIRTVKMGHTFTQGTSDSNEVWMDVTVIEGAQYDDDGERVAGTVVGRSGGMNEDRAVDPWSHFVNSFVLDRYGNRINRRNAADIFTPLYTNQMPPGAGQVAHFKLEVPPDASAPLTIEVKLQFRKFDQEFMNIVKQFHDEKDLELRGETRNGIYRNDLPIIELASDRITLPIAGVTTDQELAEIKTLNEDWPNAEVPLWQRWNDYGIGLLLEGSTRGQRGELRQAEHAFQQVEALGQFHGPINLARVYESEGSLDPAVEALNRAEVYSGEKGYPSWTASWLNGSVNWQNGNFKAAIENFEAALTFESPETREKKFDFSRDYVVINQLALAYFDNGKKLSAQGREEDAQRFFADALEAYNSVLDIDPENVDAHNGLKLVHGRVGNESKAAYHAEMHAKYKEDDNASEVRAIARERYPAANRAAESIVIYSLNRIGGFDLPEEAMSDDLNSGGMNTGDLNTGDLNTGDSTEAPQ